MEVLLSVCGADFLGSTISPFPYSDLWGEGNKGGRVVILFHKQPFNQIHVPHILETD